MRTLQPGDTVKLTGQFLRNTGQIAGGEGRKVWTVVPCSCGLCSLTGFVAVNEPSAFGDDGPRHLNAGNVYRVGTLDSRNVS